MKILVVYFSLEGNTKFIAETINSLPEKIAGIDKIEYLVIDDGSTDNTVEVARKSGVEHILQLPQHTGLARAFISGIEYCLQNNADIIVNTDADNQYYSGDIENLVREAGLLALRENMESKEVRKKHFEAALKKVKASIGKGDVERYKKVEENYLKSARAALSEPAYLG